MNYPSLAAQLDTLKRIADGIMVTFDSKNSCDLAKLANECQDVLGTLLQISKCIQHIVDERNYFEQKQTKENEQNIFEPIGTILELPEKLKKYEEQALKSNIQMISKWGTEPIDRRETRGHYRTYSFQQKREVVQLHQKGLSFARIQQELAIPQKNIVRWCHEGAHDKLKDRKGPLHRRLAHLQHLLFNWIKELQQKGEKLEYIVVYQKAKILSEECGCKADVAWVHNILRRFKVKSKYKI